MRKEKGVLITGGAGFIGSSFAKRLIAQGHKVWVIDNLLTGFRDNVPGGAVFINADISDPDIYKTLPAGDIDTVLHFAAQSSGEISNEDPGLDIDTNAYGTLLVSKWAYESNIRKLVYSSSMSVYGDSPKGVVSEEDPREPLSFYGITKYAGEHYVKHFIRKGLDATIFRFFSVYGPGQNMSNMKQGMASIFMAYLLNGEPVLVKGSKDRFRDFIYIDDLVEAVTLSIENNISKGKVYNLGSGKKTTVEELVIKEIRAFGLDPENYPVEYGAPTPADQFGLSADIFRIKTELGWEPRTTLEEGLKKMAAWVKAGAKHDN